MEFIVINSPWQQQQLSADVQHIERIVLTEAIENQANSHSETGSGT